MAFSDWSWILKKYFEMTPAERAAYRREMRRKHELQISDEDLDKDLSRHGNYETIFLKFEIND